MKMKKILSLAAAATFAASVVATTASADWATVADPVGGLNAGTGNYMVAIYCNGDATDIPATDYNIDLSKIGGVSFTLEVPEAEREFFNGSFGGNVGVSIHTKNIEEIKSPTDADKTMTKPNGEKTTEWGYYNWDNAKEYWGVIDPGAKDPDSYDIDGNYIEGTPEYIVQDGSEKPTFMETLAPYKYRIKADIVNPIVDGKCTADDIKDIRVFLQGWGGGSANYWAMYKINVTRTVIYDTDGKVMLAFDQKGNKVDGTADDEKEAVRPTVPSEDDPATSSNPTSSNATSSNATSSNATSSNATSSSANSTTSSSASSTTSSAASSNATADNASNSTTSSSSSSSGLPTGALIGIIAGVVAVIVVVVIVVVKKKKG